MPLIKLTVEYDGTLYHGWQVQPNGMTIQEALEGAIFDLTGAAPRVTGSGRTDAGVHAMAQVAHFESDFAIPVERYAGALNSHLPDDIVVLNSEYAPDGFHAQFSAQWKWYRYKLLVQKTRSALLQRRAWRLSEILHPEPMFALAEMFKGQHDFRAFCAKPDLEKSTRRTLFVSRLRWRDPWLEYDCVGDGFLYNMVRVLVGSMVMAGRGALKPELLRELLAGGPRHPLAARAPAWGLYLMQVGYDEFELGKLRGRLGEQF